ncbi:MAG TPA: DinB family protein [Abditibacteriaceae bacterium]|jgi:hypothetical protein
METTELLASQLEWVGNNYAHNLDYIPEDKLTWKPAPEASSALEVTEHVIGVLNRIRWAVAGDEPTELTPPANREDAKQALASAVASLALALRALTPEDMARIIEVPRFGDMPVARLANIAVMDTTHHHGQIAYIQTLLGDTESHFAPE